MDRSSKMVLRKIIIDFTCLIIVGFAVLLFFLFGKPYKRGFFCNDESLYHPFHSSTVTSAMLYVVGLFLPICTMIAGEYIHSRHCNAESTKILFGYNIPPCIWAAYEMYDPKETLWKSWSLWLCLRGFHFVLLTPFLLLCTLVRRIMNHALSVNIGPISYDFIYIGIFGFGAAITVLITDVAKYTIGRLRPHFMMICAPNINCSLPENHHRYIEDYTCTENISAKLLKEIRLSFPSGHSSFSAYTMIYLALYLQLRLTWKGSKLLKHLLQLLCLLMAWFTALSRVSDYKHHWSDVLAGATLGTVVALVMANCVADLFKERRRCSMDEKHRAADYETGGGTQSELTSLRTGHISYSGIQRNGESAI